MDLTAYVPVLAAAIGAASALLGVALSFVRDWYGQRLKDGEQCTFVALRLAAELENFATRCALAAGDHGEPEVQSHGQEEYVPRYPAPEFTLDYAQYEWRLVPKDLLLRVLALPHQAHQAHAYLKGVTEFSWDPPTHSEFFNERSLQFGRLGLVAMDLARDLRVRHGAPARIPPLDNADDCDTRAHLVGMIADAKEKRGQPQ